MGKLKFTFTNIFLLLGVVASALLIENVGFLTHNPTGPLSDGYFFMILAVALLSYIGLFIFEHALNKTKIDILLLVVLAILLGSGLTAIWLYQDLSFTYPDSSVHTLSYDVFEKVRLSIAFFMFILTVYSILFIFSKNFVTGRRLLPVFVILVLVGYASIIYSLIMETEQYINLFTGNDLNISVQSFFWNSNMFAGNLLMGICAAMIVNAYKKNAFSIITIPLFAIVILITCSLTSIIIAYSLAVIYFFVDIAFLYKKHPTQSFIYLTLFMLILVSSICVFALSLNKDMGFISYFFKRIYREIAETNYMTFSSRLPIWEWAIASLTSDPIKLAFGYGFGISKDVITTWGLSVGKVIASTHNGVIQIFFNYGIVGLSVYGLFLLYFLYAIIRMFRKHTYFSIMFLLSGIALLGYSVGESVVFFNSNVQGLLIGTLFYMPVIMKYKHLRRTGVITSIKNTPYSWTTMKDNLVVKTFAIGIISIICSLAPILFLKTAQSHKLYYNELLTVVICLGIVYLTYPYLVYLWHKDTSLKSFRIRAILNSLLMILEIGFIVLFYWLFRRDLHIHFTLLFPIATAVILLIEIIYYSIIKKPSFRAYLSIFVALFKTSIIGVIATIATSLLVYYFYQDQFDTGTLKYIILVVFNFVVFYIFSLIIMFKDMKEIMTYINRLDINHLHRAVLLDEIGMEENN